MFDCNSSMNRVIPGVSAASVTRKDPKLDEKCYCSNHATRRSVTRGRALIHVVVCAGPHGVLYQEPYASHDVTRRNAQDIRCVRRLSLPSSVPDLGWRGAPLAGGRRAATSPSIIYAKPCSGLAMQMKYIQCLQRFWSLRIFIVGQTQRY